MIYKWLSLDDKLKEINSIIKDVKNEKSQLEEKILGYMDKTEKNEITTDNEKLEKKKTQTKEPMNEDYIKRCLLKTLNDIETADKLTNLLITSREITQSYKLSRGGTKKKK